VGLQASFVSGDIARLSFPSGCFDGIVCLETLEHVPNDVETLAEFYRVMKPGAWLVLSVPIVRGEMLDAERPDLARQGHVRRGYTLERLQTLLIGQGFCCTDVRPWATPMFARIHKMYGRFGARSRIVVFPLLSLLSEVGCHRMAAYENVEGLDQRRYLLVVARKD
jgi:ubiquinone/menaquinone biosynthesis C-methylase UbiE